MDSLGKIEFIFYLLVVYQVKHFLADFPLQGQYMLRKTLPGFKFILPLALHCATHASLSFAIVLFVNPKLWWLAIFDFCVHFTMDRIKSAPSLLGRFNNMESSSYWNCFGFDQMVHHITHYYIVFQLFVHQFPT